MIYYIREYVYLSVSKLFYVQYFARVRYKNYLNEVVETETTLKNLLYCNIIKSISFSYVHHVFPETYSYTESNNPKTALTVFTTNSFFPDF